MFKGVVSPILISSSLIAHILNNTLLFTGMKTDKYFGSFPRIGGHSEEWGKRVPFPKSVSFFPTSGEYRYRFQNRYRYSPLAGKKDTVSKMGIEIPHQVEPVGKKDTVFQKGINIPHQWEISIPFPKSVSILPTGG